MSKSTGYAAAAADDEEREIRRRVVYLPDHPWLPVSRTGREYLLGVGRLYEIDDGPLLDHIQRLLELFELGKEGDWPIRSYSNGQKKKIALAGALVTRTPILLLDEPFGGGLDPSGILALKHVLRRLTERAETTIVITAPEPEIVEEVAQKVIVLREGRVAAFDTIEGLRKLTESNGSLAEVLARLIHPQTLDNIERYFTPDGS